MQYVETIDKDLHEEALVGDISVHDVGYVTDQNGNISIRIQVFDPYYRQVRFDRRDKPIVQFANVREMSTGDIFQVYLIECDTQYEEYWIFRRHGATDNRIHHAIPLDTTPDRCPCCDSVPVIDEFGVHCLNARCSAQLYVSIDKYLDAAIPEIFECTDVIVIVRALIGYGILKSVPGLYTINQSTLTSLGVHENIAADFVETIQASRGKIPLSVYLKSININYSTYSTYFDGTPPYMDEQRIDSFDSVESFLDWVSEIGTRGEDPMPYMNDSMFYPMMCFFRDCQDNVQDFYRMQSKGILRW
jgi:hypothetical protein